MSRRTYSTGLSSNSSSSSSLNSTFGSTTFSQICCSVAESPNNPKSGLRATVVSIAMPRVATESYFGADPRATSNAQHADTTSGSEERNSSPYLRSNSSHVSSTFACVLSNAPGASSSLLSPSRLSNMLNSRTNSRTHVARLSSKNSGRSCQHSAWNTTTIESAAFSARTRAGGALFPDSASPHASWNAAVSGACTTVSTYLISENNASERNVNWKRAKSAPSASATACSAPHAGAVGSAAGCCCVCC
mmetsp:Transcript_17416/g.37809  ORF Transcript_17416/g.37809 Transcript_17416/m.37809 type:complete len:248 (-) Transcript_17416:507-1250(-)